MSRTRRAVMVTLLAGFVGAAALPSPALASQQDNVDSLIARIGRSLNDSLSTDQWQPKYKLAGMNIEDLKKTLEYGGKISSNPVAAFGEKLDALLNERRQFLAVLVATRAKIEKVRRKEAQGTINDIGLEMIKRFTPKPGVLDVLGGPFTHNEQVIRDDFGRLKTFDEGLRKINDYEASIRPAINDIVKRVNALNPLLKAYGALGAKGFDGTYIGQFEGGGHGRMKMIVSGTMVTGSISGSCTEPPCGVDPMVGSLSGTIDKDGNVRTALTGHLSDSSGFFKEGFPFTGHVNGRVDGAVVSGDWDGKNPYGHPKGTFSLSR